MFYYFLILFLTPFHLAQASSCEDFLYKNFNIDQRALTLDEINYVTFGNPEDPPLVLIHGLDSAWQTFSNVTDVLAQDFYVVAYDQRGHAKSARGGQKFTPDIMAEDLLSLMNGLNISKANILGHSMGSRTAVSFASKYPNRVLSLTIEDMELHARTQRTEAKDKEIFDRADSLKDFPKIYPSRESLIVALTRLYGREEAESLSNRRAVVDYDGFIRLSFRPDISLLYGYQGNSVDLLDEYKNLNIPILVLQSNPKKGTALTENGLKLMQEVQPKANYVFFENAGHVIHRADEEKFLKILKGFLKASNF